MIKGVKVKSYKTNNACKLNHELLWFGDRTIARQRDMGSGMVVVGANMGNIVLQLGTRLTQPGLSAR